MHTYYSETLTSDRSNFWIETEKRINTDCAFIRYILCVIPLIQEDLFNNSNGNHRTFQHCYQDLFPDFYDDYLHGTLDTF